MIKSNVVGNPNNVAWGRGLRAQRTQIISEGAVLFPRQCSHLLAVAMCFDKRERGREMDGTVNCGNGSSKA